MPTYNYRCRECDSQLEVFHAMNESPLTTCSACGYEMRKDVSGGTATLYKCSGFSHYKGRNLKT